MTEIRKADPAAQRQALLLVVLGTLFGTLVILTFERYRTSLQDRLLSEPEELTRRVKLAFLLVAVALSGPLAAFAAHFWSLGVRVLRAQEFPPPGYRVIRDTSVVTGRAAVLRGRGLQALALCLAVASVFLGVLLYQLVGMLNEGRG